jgi:membrane protein YdbS with pleckstrin-like domain
MQSAQKKVREIIAPNEKIELIFGVGKKHLNFFIIKTLFLLVIGILILVAPVQNFIADMSLDVSSDIVFAIQIAFAAVFLLGGFSQIYQYYNRKLTLAYALTDRRLIIVTGFLSHDFESIDYFKIANVVVDENLPEKTVFRSATVKLTIESEKGEEILLKNIEEYSEVQKIIYSHKGVVSNQKTTQSGGVLE